MCIGNINRWEARGRAATTGIIMYLQHILGMACGLYLMQRVLVNKEFSYIDVLFFIFSVALMFI
jgi:hypothetical protein